MQNVRCPHCGLALTNDGILSGRVVACPQCTGQFQMPPIAPPAPPVAQPVGETDSLDFTTPSGSTSASPRSLRRNTRISQRASGPASQSARLRAGTSSCEAAALCGTTGYLVAPASTRFKWVPQVGAHPRRRSHAKRRLSALRLGYDERRHSFGPSGCLPTVHRAVPDAAAGSGPKRLRRSWRPTRSVSRRQRVARFEGETPGQKSRTHHCYSALLLPLLSRPESSLPYSWAWAAA